MTIPWGMLRSACALDGNEAKKAINKVMTCFAGHGEEIDVVLRYLWDHEQYIPIWFSDGAEHRLNPVLLSPFGGIKAHMFPSPDVLVEFDGDRSWHLYQSWLLEHVRRPASERLFALIDEQLYNHRLTQRQWMQCINDVLQHWSDYAEQSSPARLMSGHVYAKELPVIRALPMFSVGKERAYALETIIMSNDVKWVFDAWVEYNKEHHSPVQRELKRSHRQMMVEATLKKRGII